MNNNRSGLEHKSNPGDAFEKRQADAIQTVKNINNYIYDNLIRPLTALPGFDAVEVDSRSTGDLLASLYNPDQTLDWMAEIKPESSYSLEFILSDYKEKIINNIASNIITAQEEIKKKGDHANYAKFYLEGTDKLLKDPQLITFGFPNFKESVEAAVKKLQAPFTPTRHLGQSETYRTHYTPIGTAKTVETTDKAATGKADPNIDLSNIFEEATVVEPKKKGEQPQSQFFKKNPSSTNAEWGFKKPDKFPLSKITEEEGPDDSANINNVNNARKRPQ